MDLTVTIIGLALLAVLAVSIGLAEVAGGVAKRAAWRAIAQDRRHNWEEAERLRRLREKLRSCRDCHSFADHRDRRP